MKSGFHEFLTPSCLTVKLDDTAEDANGVHEFKILAIDQTSEATNLCIFYACTTYSGSCVHRTHP